MPEKKTLSYLFIPTKKKIDQPRKQKNSVGRWYERPPTEGHNDYTENCLFIAIKSINKLVIGEQFS